MRLVDLSLGALPLVAFVPLVLSLVPAAAQDASRPGPVPSRPPDRTSDEKAAEVRRLIKLGQARQQAVDARNTRIWKRWDYAVCLGCGPMPKGLRIVYTTPARVLAGFLAADDDALRQSRSL